MKVDHKKLYKFCLNAMAKCNLSLSDARIIADVLVTTDLMGTNTHGTKQLRLLLRNIREGGISDSACPKIITDGMSFAIIDGNFAMPMVTSTFAMKIAIEKASKSGIAYVAVKRSSHFGAAGYYANMAAKADMVGLAMSNVDPCMTVPGGKRPMLGTNPMAYAIPTGSDPVFLDIATSVVAVSKVYTAKTLSKKLPDKWLVDKDGIPTDDPTGYPAEGAILPFGGHKGYGIAVLVEVLSAVLTGANFTMDVSCWLRDFANPVNQGHAFLAIDVSKLMPVNDFKERMDKMIAQIKNSPKAKGTDEIFLPGEIEHNKYKKSLVDGIDLPDDVVINLKGLCDDVGMLWSEYFPIKEFSGSGG